MRDLTSSAMDRSFSRDDSPAASVLADQAQRWRAGSPAPVEECLERGPALRANTEAVLDLIYQEVLLRTERGETPRLDEYTRRFPAFADALGPIFEVHQAVEFGGELAATLRGSQPTGRADSAGTEVRVAEVPDIPGYEILDLLGRGGMGVVYRARQKSLGRSVALKVVREGGQAQPIELMRLRREAEALARVPHPNIVHIHEIGEHASRPFLALEFVEGGSLDKKLAGAPQSADDAARLVATLARAVHHAHQQGVIHRDLKPANVLLAINSQRSADGKTANEGGRPNAERWWLTAIPKITDFGLARFGERSGDTKTGDILGTPSYMAPEQAVGRTSEIGPAADIYALGAILYELLTGQPPFCANNPLETMRQVVEQEPAPLSRLQPRTPRDLETICLKCLEKDSRRRYSTAGELADDLDRFVQKLPVLARPTPVWERLAKWARRRPALATLVAVSIAAVVAVIVYNVQLQAALREANDQRLVAQTINEFLLNDLIRQADVRAQADRTFAPDPDLRVRDLLDRAATAIETRFRNRPVVEAGVRLSIGDAYRGVGEHAKAIEQFEQSVALYRRHRGPDHPETLVSMNNLASAYASAGQHEQGLRLLEKTADKLRATLGADDGRTLIGMANLANAYQSMGQLGKALPLLEEMLRKRQARFGADHPDTLTSMNNLADAHAQTGAFERAIELAEATVEKRIARLGAGHPHTLISQNNLAFAYGKVGQLDKAIATYEEMIEKCKATFGPEHPSTLNAMNNLASTYQSAHRLDEAIALLEETLKKQQGRLGPDHPRTLINAANLATAYHEAANGNPVLLERAITLYEQTLEKQKKLIPNGADALTTMNNLAGAYRDAGKHKQAITLLEEAWEKSKALSGPDHPETLQCLKNLALVTWRGGKLERAIPLLRETMEKLETRLGADHPDTLTAKNNLGQAYFQAQRPADAEPLLAEYIERSRPKLPPESFVLALPLNLLGDCRVQLRKYAEALAPLRAALALYEKHAPKDVLRYDTQSLLGAALAGQQSFTEAEPYLLESYQSLAALEPGLRASRRPLVTAALQRLVHFYDACGQPEKAAAWRKKLRESK